MLDLVNQMHISADVAEYYQDVIALQEARKRIEATGDLMLLRRFDKAQAKYEAALGELGQIMRAVPSRPAPVWAVDWCRREADAADLLAARAVSLPFLAVAGRA